MMTDSTADPIAKETPKVVRPGPPEATGAVAGIDTIRFVAALWVAFSHGARFPLEALVDKHAGKLALVSVGISKMLFTGIMAVVVFFIISGFCIHYPNVGKANFNAPRFLIRRMVRIGIPFAVIMLISTSLGKSYVDAENAVLWSIYCEIIYYAIYPLLLPLFKRISLNQVILGSSVLTVILVVLHPKMLYVVEFGPLTWLYCLPFWLAGARMAEHFRFAQIPRAKSIWLWRIPPLFYSIIVSCLIAHANFTVGGPWTMLPFAVYCYFWISREIDHLGRHKSKLLETLGLASYSMYLIHPIAIDYFIQHLHLEPVIGWVVLLLIIGLATAAFYFAVERPSHNFARFLGNRLLGKPKTI